VLLFLAALLLAACGGSAPSTGGSGSPTISPAGTPATSQAESSSGNSSGGFVVGEELLPGAYTSVVFATPLTFSVPEGWKVFEDEIGQFGLARLANDGPCLCVWQDVRAAARSCAEEPEPGVGTSAKGIATWLSKLPGMKPSTPARVTVGGLKGYRLDTAVASDWTGTCPWGVGPTVPTLVGSGVSTGVAWGTDDSSRQRLYLLDLPGGGNIAINVELCCGVDRQDQLAATAAVIKTFGFTTS
jgi:hypothetical protein